MQAPFQTKPHDSCSRLGGGRKNSWLPTPSLKHLNLKTQVSELVAHYRGGIVVAVSGGCDSMALLVLLAALRREVQFTLAVLHINYGLRGAEADGDQRHVEHAAQRYGLPCQVYRVADTATRKGRSLQEWARLIRQQQLRHYCAEHDCIAALAQHHDDLAETALYRLIRGVDVAQLPGMVRFAHPFWRPLLTVSKACLRSFCEQQGITYRTDSTNRTCAYARNRIRNLVMPQLTALHHDAAQHIVAACQQAQELQAALEHDLRHAWQAELHRGELPAAPLRALPSCKARILLRLLLGNVTQHTLTVVLAKLNKHDRWVRQLRRGLQLVYDGQKLQLRACSDGVKLARKQQYEHLVHQPQLYFVLESGASAETSEGLRVQGELASASSRCYRLHRPTPRENVPWRGKSVPRRKLRLPQGTHLYVCRDDRGQERLLDAHGERLAGDNW